MIFGRKKTGLALGGGAARGWAHLGVINYLEQNNVKPSAVAGTSIGAFIGAFYAAERLSVLREIASTYSRRDYFKLFDPSLFKSGLFQGEKINEFLQEHLGDIRIEDLSTPFAAVSTDLVSGEEKIITEGSLVEAVRASISIPVFFSPVRRSGMILADGGLANPVPVNVVRDLGAKSVIGVDLNWELEPLDDEDNGKEINSFFAVTIRSLCIMQRRLAEMHYQVAKPNFLILPELERVRLYEFHKAKECIDLGFAAAKKEFEC